ncbi:Trypsin- protease [Metarhizium guizhouense ARSEF 977]|uniref:Trypsin-protease n=1 Tax=Metarhizium guizhouense (strain ARSEF 977) TaxID=1276136 RepID=A0A0B4H2J4_METGA|nr:Trypsin- protease [Metarhizium guizhouense ARSEF 977]
MAPKAAFTLAVAFSALLASAATIDKRIVNGVDVKEGEIKFIVSMRDENGIHRCRGNLLDSYTVLTAAHCIGPKLVSVAAGTVINDINTAGVEAKIASSKIHPGYISDFSEGIVWGQNDIGIVKLATPIERSDTIDLRNRGSQKPINVVYIPGEKNPLAKKLSKVDLWIHAREHCAKYEGVGDRDTIVCAGGEGNNVCRADSGGPLFDLKTGLLIGVTSWSIKANKEFCNKAPALVKPQEARDSEGPGKELCKELGKDLDQCRPQVAECLFRASAQKNNDVDDEAIWTGIKEFVKQIFG